MYRLSQGKHPISALELKRSLGVRYPTAYCLKQKILCATDAAESCKKRQNRVEIDDAYARGASHPGADTWSREDNFGMNFPGHFPAPFLETAIKSTLALFSEMGPWG